MEHIMGYELPCTCINRGFDIYCPRFMETQRWVKYRRYVDKKRKVFK